MYILLRNAIEALLTSRQTTFPVIYSLVTRPVTAASSERSFFAPFKNLLSRSKFSEEKLCRLFIAVIYASLSVRDVIDVLTTKARLIGLHRSASKPTSKMTVVCAYIVDIPAVLGSVRKIVNKH